MSRLVIPGPHAEVAIDEVDSLFELEILVQNTGYSGVISDRQAAEVATHLLTKPAVRAAYEETLLRDDRNAASHAERGRR